MYESPIDLIYKKMELLMGKCAKQLDEDIYTAIMQYGINVDKEELIRALQYDRDQYNKGHLDGYADAMAELVRCRDCKSWEQYNSCDGTNPHRCMNYDAMFYRRTNADDFCSYGERKDNDGN